MREHHYKPEPYEPELDGHDCGACGDCGGRIVYGWTGSPKTALYSCDRCAREWSDPRDLYLPIEREPIMPESNTLSAEDLAEIADQLRREATATIARIRPGDSEGVRTALCGESVRLHDAADGLLAMPEPSYSDVLGRRFRESCGLDILGRIAAMLLDRDDLSEFDLERVVEALEMSPDHFFDGYVARMLDGIAADLIGGFHSVDVEES
jgi:hypothetical protein